MPQGTTYSFKAISGAFITPFGTLTFGGNLGIGEIVVTNTTDHTVHDTAADGVVMPSAVMGDSGNVSIRCQQTSSVHSFMLAWLNFLKTLAANGSVAAWAASSMLVRNSVNGNQHDITGISPQKAADMTYAANGQYVVWNLPACNVVNQ